MTHTHKVTILAVGVHPDDVELGCSGTLFAQQAQGHTFGILDLTQGELGTRGSAELRALEAADAAAIAGAAFRVNLGMSDGFFSHSEENLRSIIRIIRWAQPTLVLANAVTDRHSDHGRAAKLTADACFLSGLAKIQTKYDGVAQQAWRPAAVYHYIQDYNLPPDFVVDISAYIDKKMEVIGAFKSQFYDPNSTEADTPISGKSFWEFVAAKARVYGRHAGFEFGEGFTVARPVGITDLLHLK